VAVSRFRFHDDVARHARKYFEASGVAASAVDIDKDVVRRILGMYYGPESGSGGPSFLRFAYEGQFVER